MTITNPATNTKANATDDATAPATATAVAPAEATSGTRLALPPGARIRWAGLYWAASAATAADSVRLAGPDGRWHSVDADQVVHIRQDRRTTQATADVTDLVAGGGAYWLASPTGSLPTSYQSYAGWSLVVIADDAPLTLTAGHDPLEVGVLALLAETAEPPTG